MTEKLRETLMPLYKELINSVSGFNYYKAFFCVQWGKNFPIQRNCGILFVGRATNGWVSCEEDIETLFGKSEYAIFNRNDQMQWVENLEGNTQGYNTRHSAFWRIIKNVSSHFYPTNWSSYVAWSDVCKVAPFDGGNPSDSLYKAQLEDCKKILDAEIKILSPKVVVFLTGQSWSKDFIRYLNKGQETHSVETKLWGEFYEAKVYKIGEVICIRTEHPQAKKESPNTKCLINLISKYVD